MPAGALRDPREALGLEPTVGLEPGSYLVASQLRLAGSRGARRPARSGRAGVRSKSRSAAPKPCWRRARPAPGAKVDVVVTTEPSGSGPGRTYVAAAAVPLLALGPGADGPGPGGAAAATLALTKRQALRLIAAESFARKLTLLPEG